MAGAKREWPQTLVRIRPDLKEWLINQSEQNYSSINAEILLSVEERRDRITAQRERRKAATGAVSKAKSPVAA
jgi:hypothetical protein